MATTFTGTLSGGLIGSYAKGTDLTAALEAINFSFSSSYTNGTGENQANALFADTRTLAATSESFDLNAITDTFGATLNFTKIKLLYIKNKSTTAGQTLTIDGDFIASFDNGTGPNHILFAGGLLLKNEPISGLTVTNTTQDTLTLTNSASFDYDIILLGTI